MNILPGNVNSSGDLRVETSEASDPGTARAPTVIVVICCHLFTNKQLSNRILTVNSLATP